LFLDNSTLPRIIAMATNWPAYARLWTVATAGQSVASYTTTRDTTMWKPATPAPRRLKLKGVKGTTVPFRGQGQSPSPA
jgi:hypothetical protein